MVGEAIRAGRWRFALARLCEASRAILAMALSKPSRTLVAQPISGGDFSGYWWPGSQQCGTLGGTSWHPLSELHQVGEFRYPDGCDQVKSWGGNLFSVGRLRPDGSPSDIGNEHMEWEMTGSNPESSDLVLPDATVTGLTEFSNQ